MRRARPSRALLPAHMTPLSSPNVRDGDPCYAVVVRAGAYLLPLSASMASTRLELAIDKHTLPSVSLLEEHRQGHTEL